MGMNSRDNPAEIRIRPRDALIVVDMQNDFMPGGALPVREGDEIVSGVNGVMRKFHDSGMPVILTQDWHPRGHRSFASAYAGRTLSIFTRSPVSGLFSGPTTVSRVPGGRISTAISRHILPRRS